MTTERDTARAIRSWMREAAQLDDAGLERVLERLPETPQRRHRWLWPFDWRLLGSGATRSADPAGATTHRRYPTMFTATRMAALTAVIALSGSLALIVGPLQEPDQAPPAAPAEVGPPSYFTGTSVSWGSGESELETLSDRTVERFEAGFSNTVDDARLSGFGQSTNYLETIVGGDGAFYMAYSAAGRIENDGGSWAITCSGAGDTGATSLIFFQCWYDGEGGYEGLTAFSMLQPTNDSGGGSMDVSGWIYPGDPPPTLTFEP